VFFSYTLKVQNYVFFFEKQTFCKKIYFFNGRHFHTSHCGKIRNILKKQIFGHKNAFVVKDNVGLRFFQYQ